MSDTFTREDAVQSLMAADQEPIEPEKKEPEQKATPEAEAEAEPETVETEAPEGEEAEAEEDPDAEEDAPAGLDPPKNWDAEDREWFATQDPETQARLVKQEEKREGVLAKHREKAEAEARVSVDGERAQLAQISASVKQYLPQVIATHQAYWGENGFDLTANVEAYGADEALKMQARYQAEQSHIQGLVKAQELAEFQARMGYQQGEYAKLIEARPEFGDPKTAAPLKQELTTFLTEAGATAHELEIIPAWGVILALEALKSRKGLAEAKTQAKAPKPPLAPVVKPGAAVPQTNQADKLSRRFAQTGSREDAVALILQKGL